MHTLFGESPPLAGPRPRVVLVAGKDPLAWNRGGALNYARSHALAAQRAGYEVHLFCLAVRNEEILTDFGIVHRVKGPRNAPGRLLEGRPETALSAFVHWARTLGYRELGVGIHASALASAVVEFVAACQERCLLHGFSTWGVIALEAQRQLKRRGIEVPVVNNLYTTLRHEQQGKMRGLQSMPIGLAHFQLLFERFLVRVWTRRLEQRVICKSPVLVVNYTAVRRLLEAEYGALPQLVTMPYCEAGGFSEPSQPRQTSKFATASEIPRLVTLSRHDPRKGLDVFIKALAVLNGKGVAFRATIGSGGDLLEYHRGLVRSLELEQIVTFSGWVDDPTPLLANSDIFVLPSLEEGSGSIALLEAMRNRLAVVASDLDGIPEVITSEVDGLLVPPGDSRLLAEALERVIHDPAFRARLANAATARHASRANPEVFTETLRSLYDHILASCPGAPEERPASGR